MKNVKQELMTDVDMYEFINKGIASSVVSQIAQRYTKTNNKYNIVS